MSYHFLEDLASGYYVNQQQLSLMLYELVVAPLHQQNHSYLTVIACEGWKGLVVFEPAVEYLS